MPFSSKVVSQFNNLLNFDATTLGNHEFDDKIAGLVPFMKVNHLFPTASAVKLDRISGLVLFMKAKIERDLFATATAVELDLFSTALAVKQIFLQCPPLTRFIFYTACVNHI